MDGREYPTKGDTRIGNDVWIGYEATLMPGITVGDGAIIASKSVVTRDVPDGAVMVGIPARPTVIEGGAAPEPRFVPYGTPCSELFDPQTQKVELLRCELETLRKRLDALIEEEDKKRA